MFGGDGISDHASWNEVFNYWDTKLSCDSFKITHQQTVLDMQDRTA